MYVYCLFCETQRSDRVALVLEHKKAGIVRAFTPKIINRQRVQGKNIEKLYNLLPGYVFVYTKEPLNTALAFRGVDGIIRRLGLPEENYQLKDSDYAFAMGLYQVDGTIGKITLVKEGDDVHIANGIFKECSGQVLKVDYRKQRAKIAFRFAKAEYVTWVGLEELSTQTFP